MAERIDEPRTHRLRAGVDELSGLRAFVRQAVTELGATERVTADLVQAVDEATCNVMVHGYRGKPGEIEVEVARRDDRIEVAVRDRAPAFDPTGAPEPDTTHGPTPTRQGGMGVGIHLVRTMTDALRHDVRPDGGNELTLVRSIEGPAEEG